MTADDNPVYAIGPGSRVRSRGPVVGAYAETEALTIPCSACNAPEGSVCRWPDGTERKWACYPRFKAAKEKNR